MPIPPQPSLWQRAFAGLTPPFWGLLVLLMAVYCLSRYVWGLVEAWHAHSMHELAFELAQDFALNVVVAAPIVTGLAVTANLGPRKGWQRVVALAVAVLVFSLVGLTLRHATILLLLPDPDNDPWATWRDWLPALWFKDAYMAAAGMAVAEFVRRQNQSVAATHAAELDQLALEREMSAARMQVLQAQIEPHFLFNTLANVRRLYQTDPAAGRVMLDNLMRYFAVALPRMRGSGADLRGERELIEAYLNVQQIRMGRRLAFAVDFQPGLDHAQVPPMMLLTLVENALKHGINPLREGGFVRVSAHLDAPALVLQVSDSGRGLDDGSGTGTGLANIRARLAAEFGDAASLALHSNLPRGVTATITLPAPKAEVAA